VSTIRKGGGEEGEEEEEKEEVEQNTRQNEPVRVSSAFLHCLLVTIQEENSRFWSCGYE